MQNNPDLRLLQLLDAHEDGADDTQDRDNMAASGNDVDSPLADEEPGLAALFDATAAIASPDALARLAAFARDAAGAQHGPRGDDGSVSGEVDAAAEVSIAGTLARNVVSIRHGAAATADVWPGRWLLALAASLLLTMGGLSWPTPSHDAIDANQAAAVTQGPDSGATQLATTPVALESEALAMAIDDPLAGVGGVDWNGELDDSEDVDLGDVGTSEAALSDVAFGDELYVDAPR